MTQLVATRIHGTLCISASPGLTRSEAGAQQLGAVGAEVHHGDLKI